MPEKFLMRELSRYDMGTFADLIYRNALLFPDAEAFVRGAERMTFEQFNRRVNRLVHGLFERGLHKGRVLGTLLWNGLAYAEIFGACMKGGFVLAHFNPRLKERELIQVINDARADILFVEADLVDTVARIRPHLDDDPSIVAIDRPGSAMLHYRDLWRHQPAEEPEVTIAEDDPLVIFYTSGTTGVPRGAIYSHRQKMENTVYKALDIGVDVGDRHLVVLPMFHIGGDSHLWPFFLKAGCNVMMPGRSFDPDAALKTIAQERITDVHIVPTQLVALLNLPDLGRYDLAHLKRIWSAASPMPTEVLKRGLAAFGPVFMQGYGQTESGPHTTVLTRAAHGVIDGPPAEQQVLASCGQPGLGVHLRVVDENGHDLPVGEVGEIIIRSKRIMMRYWGQTEATRQTIRNGWLHTGDLGFYDARGFVYIADRKSDMIITGGENVYPRQVEEVLYQHAAVNEAVVIGVPDPHWVERVHAVVVLNPDAEATEADIIRFCKQRLAHYKAPRSVDFVDSLPKNPQGKVLKRDLRARYKTVLQ